MTVILRNASGKMHHGILFDPPLPKHRRNAFMAGTEYLAKQLNHATTYLSTPRGNHTITIFRVTDYPANSRRISGRRFSRREATTGNASAVFRLVTDKIIHKQA